MEDDKKITTEDLHFYYNREERLQRAPQIVQSHYNGTETMPPRGFFKSLVHTKTSRFLLGSIVLLIIMILFVTNVDLTGDNATLENIHFELSAFLFEETVFVTVKASESKIEEELTISVYFSASNSTGTVVEQSSIHSIFDGNENFFRTTFTKYDIINIDCTVSLNNETIQLKTKVQT